MGDKGTGIMPLPMLYVTFFALPVFFFAAWTDIKTNLLDTRPIYAVIGLAYGGFFANGISILYAVAVSISLILIQFIIQKAKIPPLGSGDFPLIQSYGLLIMLYSPSLLLFAAFMIVLLIVLGLWRWFTKNNSFAPSVTLAFLLFGLAKLFLI